MTALARLLGGTIDGTGRFAQCMKHLADTLSQLYNAVPPLVANATFEQRMVRPFLLRSMLEVGATMLVGRFDPFRLLCVSELQAKRTDFGLRLVGAIQWSGDVLADSAASQPWDAKKKPNDMSRALLGDYVDELIFRPAFEALLDFTTERARTSKAWTAELGGIEPPRFVHQMRLKASSLYSTTSKGVHHEFVLPVEAYYDEGTLDTYREDVIKLLATLGLVANFAESALFRQPPEAALECYEEIQP